ncbi:MAG: OmpA family protein [Bacteroidota bacterium]
MITRFTTALCLALVLAAGTATAQVVGTYYDTDPDGPGVRFGIGGGVSVYNGPNILYPLSGIEQEDITETNPAVTGFVEFPLGSDQLYGRLLAGILNIGADDDTEIARRGGNPFLTNEQLLVEGNLLYNLTSPRTSSVVPYVFAGLGALIADPFGNDDVADALDRDRVLYVLPVGIGLDLPLSRTLGLFGEASYRFPLNSVGDSRGFSSADFGPEHDDIKSCDEDPTQEKCKKLCDKDPALPFCEDSPEPPGNGGGSIFDTNFGSALFTGGLRLGLGGGGGARIPPPPVIPPRPPMDPVSPVDPEPPVRPPQVCDLVDLNSILFEYGSSTLSADARRKLDENVELLLDNPNCCLFIDGFTDASEHDRYGMGLAGRRAQAVYDYYLARGVAASRMQIRNRGVATPSCDKEDPGIGCERNRVVRSIPMDCERFEMLLDNPNAD